MNIETLQQSLPTMPVYEIASNIEREWKQVNYAARPYLDAMHSMTYVTDQYGQDDGKGIILYFLNNASQFRGESARLIKSELKKRVK